MLEVYLRNISEKHSQERKRDKSTLPTELVPCYKQLLLKKAVTRAKKANGDIVRISLEYSSFLRQRRCRMLVFSVVMPCGLAGRYQRFSPEGGDSMFHRITVISPHAVETHETNANTVCLCFNTLH
jgi:hypothetical protein